MTSSTDQVPPRATIIVDTSALKNYAKQVANSKLVAPDNANSPDYVEVLRVLGRHGFDVCIPDSVAFEFSILSNGKSLERDFADNQYKKEADIIRPFLQDAMRGVLPGIRVVKSGDERSQTVLSNVQETYHIASGLGKKDFGGKNHVRTDVKTKRGRNVSIVIEGIDKDQLADDAIVHMVENSFSPSRLGRPVIVLARDFGLSERLRGKAEVLGPGQLIFSAVQNGFAGEMGLNASAPALEVFDDIKGFVQPSYSRVGVINEVPGNRFEDHPIHNLLKAAKAEQEAAAVTQAPATQPDGASPDSLALKKFLRRKMRTEDIQAQRNSSSGKPPGMAK